VKGLDTDSGELFDIHHYVGEALEGLNVDPEWVRDVPELQIPLAVYCEPDIDLYTQILPTEPITLKLTEHAKLDPRGPFVLQGYDKSFKGLLKNLMAKLKNDPKVNRSHKDYRGKWEAPKIEWNGSPNMVLVVGTTPSQSLSFETFNDKLTFNTRFARLTEHMIFPPDLTIICPTATLTINWISEDGQVSTENHLFHLGPPIQSTSESILE